MILKTKTKLNIADNTEEFANALNRLSACVYSDEEWEKEVNSAFEDLSVYSRDGDDADIDFLFIEFIAEESLKAAQTRIARLAKQTEMGAPDKEKVAKAISESRKTIDETKKYIVPPSGEKPPFFSLSLPYVSDSFSEYKSKSEAKRNAIDSLRPAYDAREKAVRDATNRAMKLIRNVSIYEESGDNFFFTTEQRARKSISDCEELFKQAGAALLGEHSLDIRRPDNDFDEEFVFDFLYSDVAKTNGPYSLNEYFSNNCELIKDDCNGIFNITYRYFGVCVAAQDMQNDINEYFRSHLGMAWKSAVRGHDNYCEKVKAELDFRLNFMIREAEDDMKSAEELSKEINELQADVDTVMSCFAEE